MSLSGRVTVHEVVKMCNTPASWKCALILGSVTTWVMGILVFGLGVAMIKKPVLSPLVLAELEPVYHGLAAAVVAAVFICTFAFCGCCGAACEYQWLLLAYIFQLLFMFFYQIAVGTANLALVEENFFNMDMIHREMCRRWYHEKRNRFNFTGRISHKWKFDLEKVHFMRRCPALSDLITPTAIILLVCATFYVFLGFCAYKLFRHVRQKTTIGKRPCTQLEKLEMQAESPETRKDRAVSSVHVYGMDEDDELVEKDTTPLHEKRVTTFQMTPRTPVASNTPRNAIRKQVSSSAVAKSPRPVRLQYPVKQCTSSPEVSTGKSPRRARTPSPSPTVQVQQVTAPTTPKGDDGVTLQPGNPQIVITEGTPEHTRIRC